MLSAVFNYDASHARPSKVHKSILAPEYHLAQFVANISNPHPSWTVENTAEDWGGVQLSKNSEIHSIYWSALGLRGSLNFAFIPNTLKDLRVERNHLTGPINIGHSAEKLRDCYLDSNKLNGEIAFSELPRTLHFFWARSNCCTGKVDLTSLPPTIRDLLIDSNDFSGSVLFGFLPPTISKLFLDHNRLEGYLDLSVLPRGLHTLSLHNNSFTGVLDFSHVPPDLTQLALARNKFEGVVDISQLPHSIYFLSLFTNEVLVYLDTSKAPNHLDKICVYDPPRKNLYLSKLPTRFAKWDTSSDVWYVYNGSVPETLIDADKEENSPSGSKSGNPWWQSFDDQWDVFKF